MTLVTAENKKMLKVKRSCLWKNLFRMATFWNHL